MGISISGVVILLTGDTRKRFVSNIIKTVDESNSVLVLVGCKPTMILSY